MVLTIPPTTALPKRVDVGQTGGRKIQARGLEMVGGDPTWRDKVP